MGMPCMSCATFNRHLTAIHKASKNSSTLNLSEAASKVKELYHPSLDDYFDITVSYDGTWQKRGHTSKHGVGAVIAAKSGLILDYEVSSSFCHQCEKMKHLDAASFNRWFVHHRLVCGKNHAGSSGPIEVEGANKMWSRFEAMGFRYTTLVSDGNCKTFNELNSLKPYRPIIAIKKEECVNHVSKRLGTALRNLVSAQSKRGLTLGGRKSGSLTQVKIKTLQGYYKNAVPARTGRLRKCERRLCAASTTHRLLTHPRSTTCVPLALSPCVSTTGPLQLESPPQGMRESRHVFCLLRLHSM